MTRFSFHKPELNLLDITIEDVLNLFHEEDQTNNNPIVCEIEKIYHLLPEICDVRGGYTIFEDVEVFVNEGEIHIGDKKIISGRRICSYMEDADSIAVFVCSAGERFMELSQQYNRENDYLKAYIIDSFGSLVVEKMADYIQMQLQVEVGRRGLEISNRYSPGYCNWQLWDQKLLFELLSDNPCRISLTDSMLMMPVKSISGIIGIGRDVKKHKYGCSVCKDKNCVYRNVRIKQL